MSIRPVRFRYNGQGGIEDTSSFYVGTIAQEVQTFAPEMISEVEMEELDGEQNTYLSIDPNDFVYMLINATKEQQATIESQQQQIEQQQAQIDALAKRLDAHTQQCNASK